MIKLRQEQFILARNRSNTMLRMEYKEKQNKNKD